MKSRSTPPTTDSAKASSTETLCLLSLGSNVGDRERQLARARQLLSHASSVTLTRASRILETRALLYEEQPDFLNQIVEISTSLEPLSLLERLKEMEQELGRQERFRYGPREIDLDILTYGSLRLHHPALRIPHPALLERPFLSLLLEDLGEDPRELVRRTEEEFCDSNSH